MPRGTGKTCTLTHYAFIEKSTNSYTESDFFSRTVYLYRCDRFETLVKHDFKGDSEIDAILREKAGDNKSAFIKAAIKAYVKPEIQKEKPIAIGRVRM